MSHYIFLQSFISCYKFEGTLKLVLLLHSTEQNNEIFKQNTKAKNSQLKIGLKILRVNGTPQREREHTGMFSNI